MFSRFEALVEAFASEVGWLAMFVAGGREVQRRKTQALDQTRQARGRDPTPKFLASIFELQHLPDKVYRHVII